MNQEQTIRSLIAALAAESDPLSISPQRMAGLLEALLDLDLSSAADIEERIRSNILEYVVAYRPGEGPGLLYLMPDEARKLVEQAFS